MKTFLGLLFAMALSAWGQGNNLNGQVSWVARSTAPSGACSARQASVYTPSGGVYTCVNGTWTLLSSGGGGGVSNVVIAGTVSKITASGTCNITSTGTCTLTIPDAVVLVTPNLGTPSAGVLTNATGLPISTGVSGLATGIATFLGTPTSANLASAVTNETGSGSLVFATSPSLVTPDIGTPSAGVLTNATGLPISTGVTGLAAGIATFLGTPTSANLAAAVTNETGSGSLVFATSPTFVTPVLGTPASGNASNLTNLPITLTTTGSSGAATWTQGTNTLNIPQYSGGGGSGTVTVVGAGSLTSTALVTGGGTTTIQTPAATATMDSSGNISTPGTISSGAGSGVSGGWQCAQGTASTPAANTVVIQCPTSVTTAYSIALPGAAGTGFMLNTDSSNQGVITFVGFSGTGNVARVTSPTFVTPILGTPTSATLTNATGLPVAGLSNLGANVGTFLITPSSANLATAVTDETGSGALVFGTSPTFVTPALGTPASGVATNLTGLPVSTGISGLGTGIATFLVTPSSANLASAITDETGSGALVFATSPTLVTPALGTPASGVATNITGLPVSTGISGLGTGVATALAAAVSGSGNICLSSGSSCSGGSLAGSNIFSTTGSTTVTATSATTLIGSVTGSTTVSANTFTAGQVLHFSAQGFYSTPATPASLTIDLKIGGTTRITTGAVVQIASVTNGVWQLSCDVTTRTTGASGTQIANCIYSGTGATITPGEAPMFTSSAWTIDTTATEAIDLQATWSTATGAPTITSTNISANIPGAPVSSVNTKTGAVALTLNSSDFANEGTTVTVLHGAAAGNPSFAVVTPSDAAGNTSGSGNFCLVTSCTMVTPALGTPASGVLTNMTGLALAGTPLTTRGDILFAGTGPALARLAIGAANTLLHGSATDPSYSAVVSADLNITTTTCTAPTVLTAISATGTGTCTAPLLTQNSQSTAYTTVLGDAGKMIYHPGADTTARTWTIDSNANVAYLIGTCISFFNDTSAGTLTIAITSDTLVLAGAGTTGSRTLTASNVATACKITSTRWMISGSSGLT